LGEPSATKRRIAVLAHPQQLGCSPGENISPHQEERPLVGQFEATDLLRDGARKALSHGQKARFPVDEMEWQRNSAL